MAKPKKEKELEIKKAEGSSRYMILRSTGERVLDMGEYKAKNSNHSYREILLPYNDVQMRTRKNLDKCHHHLIVRAEKLDTIKEK